MYKVSEITAVYSKINGISYISRKVFESEDIEECKDFVFKKYNKKIMIRETIEVRGLLSKKYVKLMRSNIKE